MQQEFDLHDLAVEDARHGHQRPKIEEYGDAVRRDAPARVRAGRNARRRGRGLRRPATSCCRCATAAASISSACASAASANPSCWRRVAGFVLYALMDAVVDRYFPLLDTLETDLESIEAQIFETRRGALEHRAPVRAEAPRHRAASHAVAPLLEVVGKLYGGRVPAVCESMQEYFRDVSDHLVRITWLDRHHPRHDQHRDPGEPVHGDDRGDPKRPNVSPRGPLSSLCPPHWPASGA